LRLKNKTAIITGAASGIGLSTTRLFAAEGAQVVMVDRPQQNPEVRRTIEEYGDHVRFFQADVSCRVDNESMVRFAVDEFHALDILFNNAGVELLKAITETSDEEWDHVLDVNLRGVFLGCRAAVPVMKKVKRGVIVNTASQLGLVGLPNFSAYCASKGGVIAMTRALAVELAPYGIRVNCICPGAVETPMLEREIRLSKDPEESRNEFIRAHPIGRLGRPEEIAQAALFLASDDSSFTTGSVLVVDGGFVAR